MVDQRGVDPRALNEIRSELVQFNIRSARKTQRGCNRRYRWTDESALVLVDRCLPDRAASSVVIVGSVFLTSYQEFRMEELSVMG